MLSMSRHVHLITRWEDSYQMGQNGEGKTWKEYTAAAVLGGTAAVAAVPFALGAAGFTAGGVAAGSIAAGVQSAVYGGAVASSSVFAMLQSIGAAGLGAGAKVGLFSAGAGVAAYLNKIAP